MMVAMMCNIFKWSGLIFIKPFDWSHLSHSLSLCPCLWYLKCCTYKTALEDVLSINEDESDAFDWVNLNMETGVQTMCVTTTDTSPDGREKCSHEQGHHGRAR